MNRDYGNTCVVCSSNVVSTPLALRSCLKRSSKPRVRWLDSLCRDIVNYPVTSVLICISILLIKAYIVIFFRGVCSGKCCRCQPGWFASPESVGKGPYDGILRENEDIKIEGASSKQLIDHTNCDSGVTDTEKKQPFQARIVFNEQQNGNEEQIYFGSENPKKKHAVIHDKISGAKVWPNQKQAL